MNIILSSIQITICVFVFIIAITQLYSFLMLRNVKSKLPTSEGGGVKKVIGFFHPNCDAGAGGEKVLWQAIQAL